MQQPQGQFSVQGPEVNFGRGGQEAHFGTGPSFGAGNHNNEASEIQPFDPKEIKTFIKRKPYTQRLEGDDITYSVLPKKQNTFVMTNDRFLLLKGTEFIAYAR